MLNKLPPDDRGPIVAIMLIFLFSVIGAAAVFADHALDTYRTIEIARASAKTAPIEVRGPIAPGGRLPTPRRAAPEDAHRVR